MSHALQIYLYIAIYVGNTCIRVIIIRASLINNAYTQTIPFVIYKFVYFKNVFRHSFRL